MARTYRAPKIDRAKYRSGSETWSFPKTWVRGGVRMLDKDLGKSWRFPRLVRISKDGTDAKHDYPGDGKYPMGKAQRLVAKNIIRNELADMEALADT